MASPQSPRAGPSSTVPDGISPPTKPRRQVRLFSQLPDNGSSSEDEDKPRNGTHADPPAHDDEVPLRPVFANGTSTTRLASIVTSSSSNPRLSRTFTGGSNVSRSSTSSSGTPSGSTPSAEAGPSNPFHRWNSKYRGTRSVGHRTLSSGSGGQADGVTKGMPGNGEAGYLRGDGVEDTSDTEDAPAINGSAGLPVLPAIDPVEGKERMEWQSMLASVLEGEVLTGESAKMGEDKPGEETFRRELGQSLWWQIRAKMRGRSEEEERRRVEERRARVVDAVLEAIERFAVNPSPGPPGVGRRLSAENTREVTDEVSEVEKEHSSQIAALDQVTYVLQKLSLIEALYPCEAAVRASKPLYDEEHFQARVQALTAWSTLVTSLQAQLNVLQKWTGSDELDVTKPNTTKEKALVGKNRYHQLDAKARAHAQELNDQAADDSTFLERIMKEDNLQTTFEKRVFDDLITLVRNAKETVISHLPMFEELQLPDFQYELVRLIGFPGSVIIEALKVRLSAAEKLVDPNPMVVNDMIDSFRLIISLAVLVKQQYEGIVKPDPLNRWKIPPCLAPDYNAVLLNGLRKFFRLLHWKLKSGSRAIYFRETEVLEDEWEFLYEAAESVPGGDMVVSEHFCSLTNKLMVRVNNYFTTQLHVPIPANAASIKADRLWKFQPELDGASKEKRHMTADEMLAWYGKILDAVRMRYRKLQRFARRLTQRFDNSAEYALDYQDAEVFLDQLRDSGHFLVWSQDFADKGMYIVADGTYWDNKPAIRALISRAFSLTIPSATQRSADQEPALDDAQPELNAAASVDGEEDMAGYLLVMTPTTPFAWTGAVMLYHDLEMVDLEMEEQRVRLIADGPTSRLSLCKRLFAESLIDPETGETIVEIPCIVEQQAHLPRLQRELARIANSNYQLTVSFIESAVIVRKTLAGTTDVPDMTQNWFIFASEQARRHKSHVDPKVAANYNRICMRLAISWVSFICDSCDPTDRKTFRWTVSALRYALDVTEGQKILHLDSKEFSLLRKSVASLVSLLISHFDILGARSSMEAKKEADRVEAMRRLQRLQENIDDDFIPRAASPSGQAVIPVDRSVRLVREERLRLIAELEQARVGLTNDQHLMGQVLDEQVSEDRALVFLAASSSNIALRWQQGAFIGGGANGNVYIGFNLESGGVMAVKEIRVQDLSNSPSLYKQIKDESEVMAMLSHPNIVEYYGIEVHRDRVFIFQEYCEGGSLADQLGHGRIEDEDVVLLYTLQMLQGLEYLHSKGVEHRDVKPENILLGYNSTIKYIDFGASKVITKGNQTLAKTRAIKSRKMGTDGAALMNSLAGTPMYMAPEVIRASERGGRMGAADIWSMGCVVLEITTGRKPWQHLDNEWAIMFHIGISEQHPPLPNASELSPLGTDFIEQCFELDPSERPSAVELLEHPWLAPMVQQMTEHYSEATTTSLPSTNSTGINSMENGSYAGQMAEVARQEDADGSGSYHSTAQTTPEGSGSVAKMVAQLEIGNV